MIGVVTELRTATDVLHAMREWLNTDEPLVEAVGDTLAFFARADSQEQARRVVGTVIDVLERFVVTE